MFFFFGFSVHGEATFSLCCSYYVSNSVFKKVQCTYLNEKCFLLENINPHLIPSYSSSFCGC